MNTDKTAAKQDLSPEIKAGIRKRASQLIFIIFLMGALMFISAGRLDWIWAWIYLVFYSVLIVINGSPSFGKTRSLLRNAPVGRKIQKIGIGASHESSLPSGSCSSLLRGSIFALAGPVDCPSGGTWLAPSCSSPVMRSRTGRCTRTLTSQLK